MSLDLIFGVISFSGIVLLLVLVIIGARSKLVSTGDVSIEINGDSSNPLVVPAGTTKGLDESPLISIETSPVETSFDLAPIITNTSNKTIPEKEITPKIKSKLIFIKKCLQMT